MKPFHPSSLIPQLTLSHPKVQMMKASLIGTLFGLLALAIIGCADSAKTPRASTGQGGHEVAEDDVASNLAKLGEDARKTTSPLTSSLSGGPIEPSRFSVSIAQNF